MAGAKSIRWVCRTGWTYLVGGCLWLVLDLLGGCVEQVGHI